MRTPALVLAVVTCLTFSTPARAQAPTELNALLALEPSPGVEALLLPHVADPRVPQRWREALSDPDPDRRAAAARLIGIANVRTALGGLMQAVRNEHHPAALAEVLRALVIVGSEHSDPAVLRRLSEVPGPSQARIVSALAALRPAGLPPMAATPGPFGTNAVLVGGAYAAMLRSSPSSAAMLEHAVAATGTGAAIQALVHTAAARRAPVSAELVAAAARGDAGVAVELLDWVARVPGSPARLQQDAALVKAYRAAREGAEPGAAPPSVELALLDRWFGLTGQAPSPIDVGAAPQGPSSWWHVSPTAFVVLSRQERKALAARLGVHPQLREAIERANPVTDAVKPGVADGDAYLLSDVPAAMLADLRTLTGCAAQREPGERPAVLVFGPTGRATQATLGDPPLPGGCDRYARAIIAVAYGDPPPAGASPPPTRTVLRLDQEWVACLADAQSRASPLRSADPTAPTDAGNELRPPRKLQDRKPIYPGVALERRVEGSVVIEATISPGGCVVEARVVQSVPLLDLAALQAVSHWRYTPTVLDGRPVPVIMTITVNFMR